MAYNVADKNNNLPPVQEESNSDTLTQCGGNGGKLARSSGEME